MPLTLKPSFFPSQTPSVTLAASSKGLSGGGIAGIIIAVLIVLSVAIYLYVKRKRDQDSKKIPLAAREEDQGYDTEL